LFAAAGGWQGIRIVIGVDLVLGPLLKLIVYDIAMPRKVLYQDLLNIALIQLSCLTAGVYIVFHESPIAVIYAYDKFYILKHNGFIKTGIDSDTLHLNLMTPQILYTDLTKLADKTGVDRKTTSAMYNQAGKDLVYQADLYAPFPNTPKEADVVFSDNNLPKYDGHRAGCVTAELLTAFEKGIICFDVATQKFEKVINANDLIARPKNRD
jgi:hypothetical protein